MKTQSRWHLVIIAIFTFFACTSGRPIQQVGPDGSLTYANTGHTISGPFLEMFNSAEQPLIVFGFPISEVLPHPITPEKKVQYFQQARMEYDPGAPEGQQVTLTSLGKYFYKPADSGEDANIYTTSAACRFFSKSEYPVCYLFRQFYNEHNGEKFFGLPISDVREMDGRLVQYFEHARMEWRPNDMFGQQVHLTDLGQLYYEIQEPIRGEPPRQITGSERTKTYVRVFPAKPLVGPNEPQAVFIVVQDQLFHPIPGAQVLVSVIYPDGTQNGPSRLKDSTDANGIAQSDEISTDGVLPNQFVKVVVEVQTSPAEPSVSVTTWFRVWW